MIDREDRLVEVVTMSAVAIFILVMMINAAVSVGCKQTGVVDSTVKPDQRLNEAIEDIAALEKKVSNLQETSGKLDSKVTAAEGAIVDTKTELTNQVSQVNETLSQQITSVANTTNQNQQTLTDIKNKTVSAESGAAAAQEQVQEVKENHGKILTELKEEVANANSSAQAAQKGASGLAESIDNFEGKIEQEIQNAQTTVNKNEQFTWKIFWVVIVVVGVCLVSVLGVVVYFTWAKVSGTSRCLSAVVGSVEALGTVNTTMGQWLKNDISKRAASTGVADLLHKKVKKVTSKAIAPIGSGLLDGAVSKAAGAVKDKVVEVVEGEEGNEGL